MSEMWEFLLWVFAFLAGLGTLALLLTAAFVWLSERELREVRRARRDEEDA